MVMEERTEVPRVQLGVWRVVGCMYCVFERLCSRGRDRWYRARFRLQECFDTFGSIIVECDGVFFVAVVIPNFEMRSKVLRKLPIEYI